MVRRNFSLRRLSRLFGTNPQCIRDAMAIREKDPKFLKAIKTGEVTIPQADIADLNVNGCNGGSPEGFLCDGTLFLLKESVKQRLLRHLNARDGGVFKGQDPVWNEIANALAEAKLITKKIGVKEAGQKSCLFAIKTPMGQQRAIALHASNLAPQLREKWLMGTPRCPS